MANATVFIEVTPSGAGASVMDARVMGKALFNVAAIECVQKIGSSVKINGSAIQESFLDITNMLFTAQTAREAHFNTASCFIPMTPQKSASAMDMVPSADMAVFNVHNIVRVQEMPRGAEINERPVQETFAAVKNSILGAGGFIISFAPSLSNGSRGPAVLTVEGPTG